MEAKDTVMNTLEINGLLATGQFSGSTVYEGDHRIYDSPYHKVAVYQAEISFKAGLEEAVKWAENYFGIKVPFEISIDNEDWQAKRKEWGLD